MKILILTNSDAGLYKFRKELIERLLTGYEVYISLPYGAFIPPLEELGCRYIKTEFNRRGTNPFSEIALLVQYKKILKEVNPDVVLTYTVKPNIYGGLVCRSKGVPYITNITGLGTSIETPGPLRKTVLSLYKTALRNASCVFFQNSSNKELFESYGITGANGCLIPGSGVNTEEYCPEKYPAADEPVRFLFIGRIMRDKGIDELLDAAVRIKTEYPGVRFDIVGGCDEAYESVLERAEKNGYIHYYGQQKDVRRFIKDSSAVVLPSYHEGMANVLLEASSTGRPVIASDIPGCREIFDEGRTGIGFKPRDSEDLYRKLKIFLALPYDVRAEMGLKAREKVKSSFDRDIIIGKYMAQINKITQEKYINV